MAISTQKYTFYFDKQIFKKKYVEEKTAVS
jgi:hypothetical protein